MRKFTVVCLTGVLVASLVACGKTTIKEDGSSIPTQSITSGENTGNSNGDQTSQEKPEKITIKAYNANKEEIELEVPYDPQRIAVLDFAALDVLDALGMGNRVVGTAKTSISYLAKYSDDKEVANLGTIKEADLETVMKSNPDVIFIGGRLASSYDILSEIAPVIYLSTDLELGVVDSVAKNATTIASLFGLEEEVAGMTADFADRITKIQEISKDKTTLVGMTTSGSFNILGNDGRCSIIGKELGFTNIGLDVVTSEGGKGDSGKGQGGNSENKGQGGNGGSNGTGSTGTHGNEASFEVVVAKNPDYIFVMDCDSAIATEGAQMAQEIMENELIQGTDAYKNGNIVYLANPNVWYTAEGGINALDIMLNDVETALGIK